MLVQPPVTHVPLATCRGARVDAKNRNGQTPLWMAADHGFVDLATLLLEKGASIHSQDASEVSQNAAGGGVTQGGIFGPLLFGYRLIVRL